MTKTRCSPLAALLALLALAGCRSAHTTSAILYIEEQQYQKAVDVIHEGFLYSEDEPDAFYWLGEAYSKLAEEAVKDNDYLEAKRLFELAYESYKRAEETGSGGVHGDGRDGDPAQLHHAQDRGDPGLPARLLRASRGSLPAGLRGAAGLHRADQEHRHHEDPASGDGGRRGQADRVLQRGARAARPGPGRQTRRLPAEGGQSSGADPARPQLPRLRRCTTCCSPSTATTRICSRTSPASPCGRATTGGPRTSTCRRRTSTPTTPTRPTTIRSRTCWQDAGNWYGLRTVERYDGRTGRAQPGPGDGTGAHRGTAAHAPADLLPVRAAP